jgi:hypothetical protein
MARRQELEAYLEKATKIVEAEEGKEGKRDVSICIICDIVAMIAEMIADYLDEKEKYE